MNHRFFTLSFAVSLALSGCLPAQLDKYRRSDQRLKPTPDAGATASRREAAPQPAPPAQVAPPPPPRATIYALDKQTYRFALRDGDVWDAILTVLLHNYNLTIADRQGGIISTEWDSFFLGGGVYRNKLSLRLIRSGNGLCDLTVHNNVERLRDASQAAVGTMGATWLPASDPGNEVIRIVQNLALVLNQPPPVTPPNGQVATSVDAERPIITR